MPPFFIALSQSNPVLGDLPGNAALILKDAQRAEEGGAKLLLTPSYPLRVIRLKTCFCVMPLFRL